MLGCLWKVGNVALPSTHVEGVLDGATDVLTDICVRALDICVKRAACSRRWNSITGPLGRYVLDEARSWAESCNCGCLVDD